MIQLHQFLVYVLKYLAEDDQITNDCSEYITLKISPHHIHKTNYYHHTLFHTQDIYSCRTPLFTVKTQIFENSSIISSLTKS